MKSFTYIEDIFCHLIEEMRSNGVRMQYHDVSAAASFYTSIKSNKELTQNQGNYILKILKKYVNVSKPFFDYEESLKNPLWHKPFRVIDMSRKAWVEQEGSGSPWICLKFPFQLKDTFERDLIGDGPYKKKNLWDPNLKIRKLLLHDFNIVQVFEFCKNNDFEIDQTFIQCVDMIEEIWQNQENYKKFSTIDNGQVVLKNADEDSIGYFLKRNTGNISNDLMLAKNMGYVYCNTPSTTIERMASSYTNTFHIDQISNFLHVCYQLNGKVVIMLDRAGNPLEWMTQLAQEIDVNGYDRNDFRVCFRTNNTDDPEFNKWVSENKFGGKIESAKFLIFRHKPAKWLFKGENDVIIVATNSLYPSTSTMTRHLINNHPCVLYVGDIKPVKDKEKDIVHL